MKLTSAYLSINKKVEAVERVIAIALISAIVIIVFYGTVSRYVFNNPLFGVDRLATYLMIWLGFIGFQIATSKFRHIEVEFLKARVSNAIKYKMSIVTSLMACVFLAIFTYLSINYVLRSVELGDVDLVLNIKLWMIIAILPISFCISAIRFLFIALLWIDILKGRRKETDIFIKKII